jgi:hypothetical protein
VFAWKQALVGCVKADHSDTLGLLLPSQVRPKVEVALAVEAVVVVAAKRDRGVFAVAPT